MESLPNLAIPQWAIHLAHRGAIARLLMFWIGWILLWLPVAIPLAMKLKWDFRSLPSAPQKLPLLASLYLLAPLVLWAMTEIEEASFSQYGLLLNWPLWRSLGIGFLLAVGGLAIVFGLETGWGWVSWKRDRLRSLTSLFLPILGLGVWIGGTEELIFRGFMFSELSRDYAVAIAAITSSIIFALSHLIWDRKHTFPQLPGLLLMGFVLILAYKIDNNSIGLAWGLHAGWIWGLTCLDTSGAISYTDKGSPWLVGWYQQPLAGLMGILCLLVTAGLVVLL
jgi:membrane protease YdiL (CAAX protease family)